MLNKTISIAAALVILIVSIAIGRNAVMANDNEKPDETTSATTTAEITRGTLAFIPAGNGNFTGVVSTTEAPSDGTTMNPYISSVLEEQQQKTNTGTANPNKTTTRTDSAGEPITSVTTTKVTGTNTTRVPSVSQNTNESQTYPTSSQKPNTESSENPVITIPPQSEITTTQKAPTTTKATTKKTNTPTNPITTPKITTSTKAPTSTTTTKAPTTTTTTTAKKGSLDLVVTLASDWGSSGQYDAIITNNTGSAVSSWTVSYTLPSGYTITNAWGCKYTVSGQKVTFTNDSYNGALDNGGSTDFHFQFSK